MTTNIITKNLAITLLGALLAVSACDSGDSKDGKDAKVAKKDGKTPPAKVDAKKSADTKTPAKIDAKADDAKADDAKADGGEAPTTAAVEAPPKEDDVDVAATAVIAKAIEADPANADAILEKNGMDRAKFEITMAAIAKDELKSDMYIQALLADTKAAP